MPTRGSAKGPPRDMHKHLNLRLGYLHLSEGRARIPAKFAGLRANKYNMRSVSRETVWSLHIAVFTVHANLNLRSHHPTWAGSGEDQVLKERSP